jgi:hypothetical protein
VVARVVADATETARLSLVRREGQLPNAARVLLEELSVALTGRR